MKKLLSLLTAILLAATLSAQIGAAGPQQQHVSRILTLLRDGRSSEAADALDSLERTYGSSADTRCLKGLLFYTLDRPAEAAAELEAALAIAGTKDVLPKSYISTCLARALYGAGRTDDAIRALQQAIRADRHNAVLLNELSRLYAGEGRLKEAERECRRAIHADPTEQDFRCDLALLLYRRGKPLEAFNMLSDAILRDESNARARRDIANLALYTFQDTETYINQYLYYLYLDPTGDVSDLLTLSQTHCDSILTTVDYVLNNLAETDEQQAYWSLLAGKIELTNGLSGAEEHIDRALRLSRDSAGLLNEALYVRIILSNALGDTAGALSQANSLVNNMTAHGLNPAIAHFERAKILYAAERHAEAEADLTATINHGLVDSADVATAYMMRAELRQDYLGQGPAAGPDLDSALRYAPDEPYALLAKGKHCINFLNDAARANRCFERVLEVDTVPDANSCRAFAWAYLGDPIEADRWQHRILAEVPAESRGTALYNAACLYSVLGNRQMALNYLMQAMDEHALTCSKLRSDSDFDLIRSSAEFQSVLRVICSQSH